MSAIRRLSRPALFPITLAVFGVVGGLFVFACSASMPGVDDSVTGSAPSSSSTSNSNNNNNNNNDDGTLAGECATSLVMCSGKCVDVSKSMTSCGTCGKACATGEMCTLGSCTPAQACSSPRVTCDGECIDVQTDMTHCGSCEKACAPGQACSEGNCIAACPTGTVRCGAVCVEPNADETHCGATAGCGVNGVGSAGSKCGTANNTACLGGQCIGDCEQGKTQCGSKCVNVATDNKNCGACGNACAGGTSCTNRICCGAGMEGCMGVCRNTNSDPDACGSCGVKCAVGESCVNGGCQ